MSMPLTNQAKPLGSYLNLHANELGERNHLWSPNVAYFWKLKVMVIKPGDDGLSPSQLQMADIEKGIG